ncbi:hypothetical protein LB506_000743 [Fusarium annulatum]|nr:hypothetical protein LB506_000743 [Fusarium annulatum]
MCFRYSRIGPALRYSAYHPQRNTAPIYLLQTQHAAKTKDNRFTTRLKDRRNFLLSLCRTQQLGNIQDQAATSQH